MLQKSSEAVDKRYVLNIVWVAHEGAGNNTGINAENYMLQWLPRDAFEMTEQHPDIILFMSGGSEKRAILLIESDRPVLLLSIRGNNAYAAATEVMAWMVNHSRFAMLADAIDAFETGLLNAWCQTVKAWNSLRGEKAGLIGSVSNWLVASYVTPERLKSMFEVTLETIPWNTLQDYSKMEPDTALMRRFSGADIDRLTEVSQVLALLRHIIVKKELSAIAVECFSLVQQRKVTACLALAQLNSEGIVAACEGDLASMAGMMLSRAVTSAIPWMANTTRITGDTLLLTHCTAAFNIVSNIKLTTHYETDCSLAIKGVVQPADVTVFRLSDTLDKAFIAEGKVVRHPNLSDACRTQAEIVLQTQSLKLLQVRPLGNHLLMVPGKCAELLRMACMYKGIRINES